MALEHDSGFGDPTLVCAAAAPGARVDVHWREIPEDVLAVFRAGAVIPAHPLALDANRSLDRRRQRALTRYYLDAGSGGLAVGVHTTQFAIREFGLYEPVLELAMETAQSWTDRPLVLIAGAVGRTDQAVTEARTARSLGYHAVLFEPRGAQGRGEDALIEHSPPWPRKSRRRLLPAAGGRRPPLSRSFWRRLAGIDNVVGIKVAPFNRYATLDVVHGVAEAGAQERISLYTGNDDQSCST